MTDHSNTYTCAGCGATVPIDDQPTHYNDVCPATANGEEQQPSKRSRLNEGNHASDAQQVT